MMDNLYKESAKPLQMALKKTKWWHVVQDEVKTRLDVVFNHFDVLGPAFRDAFVSNFEYEGLRRRVEITGLKNKPGALFGSAMSNETYECGKVAAKTLLRLDDWTDPNEADVQACISVCNHLDHIDEIAGIIKKVQKAPIFSKLFEKPETIPDQQQSED